MLAPSSLNMQKNSHDQGGDRNHDLPLSSPKADALKPLSYSAPRRLALLFVVTI